MKMYMQALHRKLDVVLVQILPYNCSETDYSFCEDSPPSRTPPSTRTLVTPSDPFSPRTIFFAPPPLFVGRSVLSFVSPIRLGCHCYACGLHARLCHTFL